METTLVEVLEKEFQKKADVKAESLAACISNELIDAMPRVSPELFTRERNVKISLSKDQREIILKDYLVETPFDLKPNLFAEAKIPLFAYGLIPQDKVVYLRKALAVALTDISMKASEISDNNRMVLGNISYNIDYGWDKRISSGIYFPLSKDGKTELEIRAKWTSPFKLNVCARMPEIPESFREIGDDAIALYYQQMSKAPSKLRKSTSLLPPRIGILWSPKEEKLYCSGEIPEVKNPPVPKRDPALVLDISDGDKSYRHVVATWNIDEELPYKNWLAEFTEGG